MAVSYSANHTAMYNMLAIPNIMSKNSNNVTLIRMHKSALHDYKYEKN